MLGAKDRQVEWRVMYGLFDGATLKTFSGSLFGTVATSPRGKKGWGFDTVFIPRGSKKTYAQMSADEKMKNSARTLALLKLRKFILRATIKP